MQQQEDDEWYQNSHYLGYATFQTPNTSAALVINIIPSYFRDFILSCPDQTKATIFSNDPQIPVTLLHFTPNDDDLSNFFVHEVTLAFHYNYSIDVPILGGKYHVHPRNALGCFFDHCNLGLDLLHKVPDRATGYVMAPFLFSSYLQPDLDLQFRYRWVQSAHRSGMVLRLRIYQDPIPKIPTDAPLPPVWRLLGTTAKVDREIEEVYKELLFAVQVLEFVQSVPEGQMRDDFYKGRAIRASNVYTPTTVLQGLQVKVVFDVGYYLITISIGSLVETNPFLRDKRVAVYYRWRGVALELRIQLVAPPAQV